MSQPKHKRSQPKGPIPFIIFIGIGFIALVKTANDVSRDWAAPALILCALMALGLWLIADGAGKDPAIEETADIINLMPWPGYINMREQYADLVDANAGIWKWKAGWNKERFIKEVLHR